jgi:hypothetical protein
MPLHRLAPAGTLSGEVSQSDAKEADDNPQSPAHKDFKKIKSR